MTTEQQSELDLEIGTKDFVSIKPARITITGLRLDVKKKGDKEVGKLLVLICRHPDREEPIELSKIKHIGKDEKRKATGLWYNKDQDNKIQKGSPIASLMTIAKVSKVSELVGKEFDTEQESETKSYLCIKAY